jgi:CBS domain-containing protein
MNADVTVRELMDREYVGVSESDDLIDTVELLLREDAESAVVQRGGEHVGVLTERDVLALLVDGPDPEGAAVKDAMTESVPTVVPDATLDAAASELATRDVSKLVVTNGAEPLGVITEQDLLASRTYGTDTVAMTEETPDAATVTAMEADAGPGTETEGNMEDQSICEGCGTLTSDLASFNGQLLCADCRDI